MRDIIHVSIIGYVAPAEVKLVFDGLIILAFQYPHCLSQRILDSLSLLTKAIERLVDSVDARV